MNRGNSTIPVDEDWETGDEIDWRYYWSIINRRKWSIIGLALGVGLLTTLVVFAMTPIYRASTTLLIESQAPNVVSIQEVYGLDTRSLHSGRSTSTGRPGCPECRKKPRRGRANARVRSMLTLAI